MRERTFHLYSKGTGPYELVPTGWSFLAALLGPFWAIANGLLARYVVLSLPLIPLTMLVNLVSSAFLAVVFAYGVGALLVYFPIKAFPWREQVLQNNGYKLQSRIVALSAQDALRKYAASVQQT